MQNVQIETYLRFADLLLALPITLGYHTVTSTITDSDGYTYTSIAVAFIGQYFNSITLTAPSLVGLGMPNFIQLRVSEQLKSSITITYNQQSNTSVHILGKYVHIEVK